MPQPLLCMNPPSTHSTNFFIPISNQSHAMISCSWWVTLMVELPNTKWTAMYCACLAPGNNMTCSLLWFNQSNYYKTRKHWHLLDYILVQPSDCQHVLLTRSMHGAECWTDYRLVEQWWNCGLGLQLVSRSQSEHRTWMIVVIRPCKQGTVARSTRNCLRFLKLSHYWSTSILCSLATATPYVYICQYICLCRRPMQTPWAWAIAQIITKVGLTISVSLRAKNVTHDEKLWNPIQASSVRNGRSFDARLRLSYDE